MTPRWIVVSGIIENGQQQSFKFVAWAPWRWLARRLARYEQHRLASWAERPCNMFIGIMTSQEWVTYQNYRTSLLTSGNPDFVLTDSEDDSTS
jgi:hypothetical protein